MKILKKFLKVIIGVLLLIVLSVSALAFSLYSTVEDLRHDVGRGALWARIELYNRGYVNELTRDDVLYIYHKSCYRQCHGESAMITAVLTPAGWMQVVERMRVKEGVNISGKEAEAVIGYLEERYPATTSAYSYETRKKVHNVVWRNDMGINDIYCDVFYVTPEYLESIGANHLVEEYDLANYHVFITSFTVHEGEIELADLAKHVFLRTQNGTIKTTPPWKLRFQTADKHHYEAIVRFDKNDPAVAGALPWFELVIKNIGGPEDRVFRWDLPLVYPPEVLKDHKGV